MTVGLRYPICIDQDEFTDPQMTELVSDMAPTALGAGLPTEINQHLFFR